MSLAILIADVHRVVTCDTGPQRPHGYPIDLKGAGETRSNPVSRRRRLTATEENSSRSPACHLGPNVCINNTGMRHRSAATTESL